MFRMKEEQLSHEASWYKFEKMTPTAKMLKKLNVQIKDKISALIVINNNNNFKHQMWMNENLLRIHPYQLMLFIIALVSLIT